MLNYEITFIVDPVLSSDEIKATAQTYLDMLKEAECQIVHNGELGLKQLAYPINRRTSGVYFCIEFQSQNGTIIPRAELALTRDERIMRFLTVRLDRYGVKYNQDKRDGKIGTKKREEKAEPAKEKAKSSRKEPAKSSRKVVPVAAAAAAPAAAVVSDSKSEEE